MSRPKLPPRLTLRADRPTKAEAAAGIERRVWVIKDGDKFVRTNCAEREVAAAERKLGEYLGGKHEPRRLAGKAAELSVGDILTVYAIDKAAEMARPKEALAAIERLEDFWGEMTAAEIIGANCRAFTEHRGTQSGARRDLEVLRAAVRHYKAEHGMEFEPVITLPEKSQPRERWLTRQEAAALLRACLWPKASQDGGRAKGKHRRPRRRHLARFILIALYTATRHDAILGMQWHPNTVSGWFDLDEGRMHRRAPGTKTTKKRKPVARIPHRLAAHLRRWRDEDGEGVSHVVHFNGRTVGREKRAFRAACEQAGLGTDVVPHTLRHTAITWLMQEGVDIAEVSGFAGVSVEELQRTYWHHHPDFQENVAASRMGNRAHLRAQKKKREADKLLSA